MLASIRTVLADGYRYPGALVVAVALFVVSEQVLAQNLYGSIAFAQTGDGGYAGGIAWNAQSHAKARQSAIAECRWAGGGSTCREVGWFRNACGAIAIGDADGYGTGWGDSSDEAERAAMNECQSQNSTCHIEITRCTELSVAVGIDRAARRQIQLALAAQGFDPGAADGIFGPRTQAALRAWQASKGYAATGTLTSEQVRILRLLQPQRATASVNPDARKKKTDVLWGSIAFSQNPNRGHAWAIVWNSEGTTEAERIGLEACRREGGENCQEVGWFRNACGALAIGDGNGFGAGWGETTEHAEQDALEKCRVANQDCRIEVSRCSDKPNETSGIAKVTAKEEQVVVLEPKCLDLLKNLGSGRPSYQQCWAEFSNKPGCFVFGFIGASETETISHGIDHNRLWNLLRARATDMDLMWTGRCTRGVADGEGIISIGRSWLLPEFSDKFSACGPGLVQSWNTLRGEMRKGKLHGKWRYNIRVCESDNSPSAKYTRQSMERLRRSPECVNFDNEDWPMLKSFSDISESC